MGLNILSSVTVNHESFNFRNSCLSLANISGRADGVCVCVCVGGGGLWIPETVGVTYWNPMCLMPWKNFRHCAAGFITQVISCYYQDSYIISQSKQGFLFSPPNYTFAHWHREHSSQHALDEIEMPRLYNISTFPFFSCFCTENLEYPGWFSVSLVFRCASFWLSWQKNKSRDLWELVKDHHFNIQSIKNNVPNSKQYLGYRLLTTFPKLLIQMLDSSATSHHITSNDFGNSNHT